VQLPARQLPDCAEPVEEHKLIVGRTYFSVQFLDEDLVIPIVEPVVYLGQSTTEPTRNRRLQFQYAKSCFPAECGNALAADEVVIFSQAAGQCRHIFEFEQALDILLRCSLRRAR
jgi:hypothetical protein